MFEHEKLSDEVLFAKTGFVHKKIEEQIGEKNTPNSCPIRSIRVPNLTILNTDFKDLTRI